MKRQDLEKLKGLTIANRNKGNTHGIPGPKPEEIGRREQRELDRAAGLVPFAVKLNSGLVAKLNAQVASSGKTMTEVVTAALEKGMAAK